MPKGKHKTVSKAKAREILRHGEVGGEPLTEKQKGYMGARAGGAPVKPPRKKTTKRPRARRTAGKRTASRSRKRS